MYGATAAVAMQQAPYAAWNVYASLMSVESSMNNSSNDFRMLPFQYISLGEMLTLGTEDAPISSMGIVQLSGASASILRRLIYVVRMPTAQQALQRQFQVQPKKLSLQLENEEMEIKCLEK